MTSSRLNPVRYSAPELLLKAVRELAGDRLGVMLDLGCGTGYCTQQLRQRFLRAELLALGVPIKSNRDEFTGEELYTLTRENYFLPPLHLTDRELAALNTSLFLLEGQFAYAAPLRLALQNLGRRKARTLLLIAAVALGSGVVFTGAILMQSIQRSMEVGFTRLVYKEQKNF